MKEVTMFYLESCPFCRQARQYMQELRDENPGYQNLPVKMIEENAQRALADSYDYYYVPCYYIGKEKIAEGSIDKAGVEEVFNRAMEA